MTLSVVWMAAACGPAPLHPEGEELERASAALINRLQADAFSYFRFVNRPWINRVCEAFAADLPDVPSVRLHGDAHIEQFAVMDDSWGLDDFDDSARGPALVDIMRFLGAVDLAARLRSWDDDRDVLFDRFFDGYRRGLTETDYLPERPDIVRALRAQTPRTRVEFLAWGETQMEPMTDAAMKTVVAGMKAFADILRRERPELAPEYFEVSRAGWLRMGVGSAGSEKVLFRVRGASADPADDQLLEAKEVKYLGDLKCVEATPFQSTLRVIDGTRQLGRLKHEILAAGPEGFIPEVTARGRRIRDWWIRSWDPSYREVRLKDLRSVDDLAAITYDSAVQLAAGSLRAQGDEILRKQALASIATREHGLRSEATILVDALLRGWREFRNQR